MMEIWQPGDEGSVLRQRLHTTIYTQTFSPCGKYLAAGTNFGHIAIFSVAAALSADAEQNNFKPIVIFKAHNGPVYSLESTDRLLISGGSGDIQAWLWTEVTAKNAKVAWALSIPTLDQFSRPETNSLAVSTLEDTRTLYAGCGDNKVHLWDIESGQFLHSLEGHSDYVHSVVVWNNGTECASASEDGTVRLWDARCNQRQSTGVIKPYLNEEMCARPQLGKWLSCVAVDKSADWLVCGGGPHLCMWHLRTLNVTSVFHTTTAHNTVGFQDDLIISGGGAAHVYHWSVNGEKKAQVPCSPTNIFSIIVNERAENTKVMSIVGNKNTIDICTNFGYKAFSLSAY